VAGKGSVRIVVLVVPHGADSNAAIRSQGGRILFFVTNRAELGGSECVLRISSAWSWVELQALPAGRQGDGDVGLLGPSLRLSAAPPASATCTSPSSLH
jgi:hypothetical protein